MANPNGHVILDEEEACAVEAHCAALEAELPVMHLRNEELMCGLREQEKIVAVERLRAGRKAQAQMREFANMMVELMAGRRGPEIQLEVMHIGVNVEKPENYDGSKQNNLDTWLFQAQEHLNLIVILEKGHVPYAVLVL